MAYKLDSKIQHGCNAGAIADDIDYGPYTSDQWARLYKILFTGDQEATQGVVRGFEDELEVSGAGVAVTVKQGAGICNGHFLVGIGAPDWTVAVVPPTAGHTRCDYVVMLENNTAGIYAPGVATMECPGTADYGGIADQVPEYACRLAVIKGAEDAACPPGSLSQTTNLWMTPLASIEWNDTQTIETVTDLRHYIHEYDVDILVSAINSNASGNPVPTWYWYATPMGDGVDTKYNTHWELPTNYVRGLTISCIVQSDGTGNAYLNTYLRYGGIGESLSMNNQDAAAAAINIPIATVLQEILVTVIANPDIGDYFGLMLERDGANVLDTLGNYLFLIGWRIQYVAADPWN